MRSMSSIRSYLLALLSLAPMACCRPKPPPLTPVQVDPPPAARCLTEAPVTVPDLMTCERLGNSHDDCVAAYTLELERWAAGAWAKCGGSK